jgi:hypothetical protein
LAALLGLLLLGNSARGADDWRFDVVHLKKGNKSFQGLLVEEKAGEVRFKCVFRKPGAPTVVFPDTFKREDIDRLDLLSGRERELLAERLAALARERTELAARFKSLGAGTAGPDFKLDPVELSTVSWGKDKGKALGYSSDFFRLACNCPDRAVVGEAVIRLEQVYAAYARFLPPRRRSAAPTTILLAQSAADYRLLLRDQGINLLNPALFDPGRNQVVCLYELPRLSADLARVHQKHQQVLKQLKDQEDELGRAYKGKIPPALRKPIDDARKQVELANRQNEKDFETEANRSFQPLYHEAFHAYLANFVYPPKEGELPRWLNEGLALVFDTAFVEAGELRVGHADRDRLAQTQAALRKNDLIGLADLLKAGPKHFLIVHGSDKQTSDRHYLTSWALAFYLTFDRKLLDTKALDQYVRAVNRGTDPLEAFRELVGQPLTRFEADFRQYLLRLQPDGSLARLPPK